jgi:hypothetical protein
LHLRMSLSGSLLWRRLEFRRPSGSIDKTLNSSCECGSNCILGLDKEGEIDRSKLDLLSKPSEISEVFSLSHQHSTCSQPSESAKWARRPIVSGILSARERILFTASRLCPPSAISVNVR